MRSVKSAVIQIQNDAVNARHALIRMQNDTDQARNASSPMRNRKKGNDCHLDIAHAVRL